MEGAHPRRVALRAAQVGDALGLSPGRLRDLAIGGLLHDIGKLSVPDAILNKPGPLSEAEYHLVMQHVFTGEALLRELGGFSPMVHRLVRGHHERFDGSGYPRAVAGDPIRSTSQSSLSVTSTTRSSRNACTGRRRRTSVRSITCAPVPASCSTRPASRRSPTCSRASGAPISPSPSRRRGYAVANSSSLSRR